MKKFLLMLLLFVFIAAGLLLALYLVFAPDSFDRERWKTKPMERVEMVDNLLSDVKLKGKTKAEIVDLLGKQEDGAYFKERSNLVYYLGNERGFISIDSEWLVIWFDENNMVKDYEITTD